MNPNHRDEDVEREEALTQNPSEEAPEAETPKVEAQEVAMPKAEKTLPLLTGRVLTGILLAALTVGVLVGHWVGSLKDWGDPLGSCEAAADTVTSQLKAFEHTLNRRASENPDVASQPARYLSDVGAALTTIQLSFEESACEPAELLALIDYESFTSPTTEYLNYLLAELGSRYELENLPDGAEKLRQVQDRPGQPRATVVPEELRSENLLIVYVDRDCDCFQDLKRSIEDSDEEVRVLVANEGEASKRLAANTGWELYDPEDLPLGVLVEERPSAVLTRSGVIVDWLRGEEAIRVFAGFGDVLTYPINPAAELVHRTLVSGEMACDGYRAGGVVVNHTDRPIHVVLNTDPNVSFGEEGLPESQKKFHDLGVIEPYGHQFFEVFTGSEFYAPCWISYDAVYADGEWRGVDYQPPRPPADVIDDPKVLLEEEGFDLPTQVIPSGLWPAPSDVRPVPEEER